MFLKANLFKKNVFKTNYLRLMFFKTIFLRKMFFKTNPFKPNFLRQIHSKKCFQFKSSNLDSNPNTRNLLEQNMTQ